MKIAIYNLEPQYQNHALEQIKAYHLNLGHEVEDYLPLKNCLYDKIYCSSIFTFTPKDDLLIDERWECGGTGFYIYKKLPPEIEGIKIHKDFGWTQRGCDNNCQFCVVPRKEGCAHPVGDIYDIWSGKRDSVTLYDNNILQLPDHFKLMCKQLKKTNLKVDWNQGLDIRLIDSEVAAELSSLRHFEYHFAFDSLGIESAVYNGVEHLKSVGINRSCFYVLVGLNTAIQEDIYRLELLRSLGQNAFVMRYRKVDESMPDGVITKQLEPVYNALARWANIHAWFHRFSFSQWLLLDKNVKRYKNKFDGLGIWSELTKAA